MISVPNDEGFYLVWHRDKGELYPVAWVGANFNHPEFGANLYPPAEHWQKVVPPDNGRGEQ